LSKRRRTSEWVPETIEFSAQPTVFETFPIAETTIESEDEWDEFKYYDSDTTKYVEEAHEALSRLFTKTNKRSRQIRGMRRNDAWS
jgi:hypothetical protein